MNFLEARAIVSRFKGGDTLRFVLAMSGSAGQLEVYLQACAAQSGRRAEVRTLPFNTLAQTLLQEPVLNEREVFLLLPWDFAPETDWRSGLPVVDLNLEDLQTRAAATAQHMAERKGAQFLYLPAEVPPLFSDLARNAALQNLLAASAVPLGAHFLPPDYFSLATYLANGCPVAGRFLGETAERVIQLAVSSPGEPSKILVTDLDHSLWAGVVAEDGLEGIHYSPDAQGYKHFLYQTFLARLKRQGALLAAVSRNDSEVALGPLRNKRMTLGEEDFVCVVCSYHAKSAQIDEIARRLNLGLESVVFVDDNPVELAEVSARLPRVRCLQFPKHEDEVPNFFHEMSRLFARKTVTPEDIERTEMYRRRLKGLVPADLEGADLTAFLRSLQMNLAVRNHSRDSFERAVQLINKTNQFNLNGRRVTSEVIASKLAAGARLFGASLTDRHGSHGEILACLLSPDGIIQHFVMSCRVFQRRVEYAFLAWLASNAKPLHGLDFASTARNEPFRNFLRDPGFQCSGEEMVRFDAARFADAHSSDLQLFTLQGPNHA